MRIRPSWLVYKLVRGLARLFFPRPELIGLENLPDEPCVLIGNHAQMYGPVYAELYIPRLRAIWCAEEMMHLREVPAYAYRDFWSDKPKSVRWFFKLASYAIAPLAVCVFNNAHCIGVYRDMRVINTFRQTVAHLKAGETVVIFPEHDPKHNHILYEFQEGFVDVERMYRHQTGRQLAFVPMYVAPGLRRIVFGTPVRCNPEASPAEERLRVSSALMDAITKLAEEQPEHIVVPYRNIPRDQYPVNHPREETKS